jgi:hypothetical protein
MSNAFVIPAYEPGSIAQCLLNFPEAFIMDTGLRRYDDCYFHA